LPVKLPPFIVKLDAAENIAGLALMIRHLSDLRLTAWTYPAFDKVAREFPDPELCAIWSGSSTGMGAGGNGL
jgi:hypothetical protein